MEFLTIEHLCKTYGKGENAVKALDDVSFTVPKGSFQSDNRITRTRLYYKIL